MIPIQTTEYRLVHKLDSLVNAAQPILQVRHRHLSSAAPGILVWGTWQDVPTVTIDKEGKECSQ